MTPWPLMLCIFGHVVLNVLSKGLDIFSHLVDLLVAVSSILVGVSDGDARIDLLTMHGLALQMGGFNRLLARSLSFGWVLHPCATWTASLEYPSWWHVRYANYESPRITY